MKLSIKKLNAYVAFILAVICITVGLSLIDFNALISRTDAEESQTTINPDQNNDNNQDDYEEELQSQGGTTLPTKIVFENAWQAYNYALEMEKKSKSYREYLWTVHGDAEKFPVTVDYTGKRKIYDNLTEIYVINSVQTIIDVGDLGINIGAGKTFTSYTCFDMVNQMVQLSKNNRHTLQEDIDKYKITTYQIPYIINKNTAKAYLKDDPTKKYYEVQMILNSKSWGTYQTVLKDVVGNVDGLPKISSITIVIKISKATGRFISFDSTESYSLVYNYNGIKANIQAKGKVFIKYNYTKDISKDVADMRHRVGMN